MNVKEIKFGFNDQGTERFHTFALGLGPCGRWVTDLKVEISLAALTITQTSYTEDMAAIQRRAIRELRAAHRDWEPPYPDAAARRLVQAQTVCERLQKEPGEVKVFVYRLEDIRGRIVALQ